MIDIPVFSLLPSLDVAFFNQPHIQTIVLDPVMQNGGNPTAEQRESGFVSLQPIVDSSSSKADRPVALRRRIRRLIAERHRHYRPLS